MERGQRLALFRDRLIGWFEGCRRDLPWRRRRDPYAVWLSEVMLQQTQVVTVVPYFNRFMERFPTIHDLAAAPLDDVLSLWSGLGYYARARNLHRAAKAMDADGVPATAAGLRKLPGLGPYTAAAIATFAFGEAVPVLDGNVARVLCRVEGLELPDDQNLPQLKELSGEFLDRARPGPFNEAMMELGALACVPGRPKCGECPVASLCRAFANGDQERLPLPRVRLEKKPLRVACAVVKDESGRTFMCRRAERGLFGGLWELPSVEIGPEDSPGRALEGIGFRLGGVREIGRVKRTLTHRILTIELWPASFASRRPPVEGRFIAPDDWPSLGLSTAMKKSLSAVTAPQAWSLREKKPAAKGRRKASG